VTAPRRRRASAGAVAAEYVRSAEIDPRGLPPGPTISPSEQSLHLLREPEEFLAECGRRYGDSFTVRLSLFPPIVFVSHPRSVEQVFSMDRDKDRFRAGEGNAIQLSPLGPDSILVLDGERHARMKHFLRNLWDLKEYLDVVRQSVHSTVDRWRTGDRISLRSEMERIALDVILRAILGLDRGTHRDRVRELLVRWLRAADDVTKFLTSFAPLMKEVDAALYEVIARRRREGGRGPDLLSKLLAARDDDGARLTDPEIRDQVTTLIAAGHDTTATVMAWAFFHLFTEPAVLSRLHDELPPAGSRSDMADYLKRKGTYLSAVLDETMRLHPVISGVHRMLHRATRIGRYLLPKGVIVAPCMYLAHRRPEVWREAERFRPERFFEVERPEGAYFPFGGGARACLGQDFAIPEMKIVVHEILQRARLRIEPGYQARAIRRGVTHVPDRGVPAIVLAS
jgi:cytochrome P450